MNPYRHGIPITIALSILLTLLIAAGLPGAAADEDALAANAGWEEVGAGSATGGGISNTSGRSDSPSHAITPGGAPVVAWDDDRGDGEEIYVRTWNGSTWAEIGNSASGGGVSSTSGASTSPSVAVAADGAPIVAWEVSAGSDYEIYLRRWNGSSWVEMGGSASGGGISNNSGGSYAPSLIIGTDGAPIVAWYDASGGDWEIYVKRWNGSSWVEMGSGSATGGGISNNSGSSRLPALAVGSDNTPVIAWEDNSNGNWEIYVRQWNGTAWVELGSGSATGGGISNNSGTSIKARSAVGPGNLTFVTWEDNSDGDAEIYVRRWSGSAWVEMGSGSATGGGISNNGGSSSAPIPAIGQGGTTVIAWNDNSGSNVEAYVRRWNDSSWIEMDAGSATGGGISNNAGNSYSPAPVVAPDGRVFIVWADATSGNYEIYARSNPPVSSVTCYTLSRSHTGSGADPVASPANSSGCSTGQYTAGQSITLTAAPSAGWQVSGWGGTSNDGSTSTSNSLVMPAANHAVSVNYEQIPTPGYFSFAPMVLNMPYVPPPCFPGPNEVEQNNIKDEANGPLCNGQTYYGLPNDLYDVFKFEMSAAGSIVIELNNFAAANGQLGLLTADFKTIAYDVTPTDGFRISRSNEPAGTYFIVIHTPAPKPGSSTQYSLRATFADN